MNKNFFCGYASIFNVVDSYNDIILNGAFKNSIKQNKINLCWQHDPTKIVGNINILCEDSVGLYLEGDITKENVYSYVKSGFVNGLSIGYNVNRCYTDKKNRRIIEEIDLKEISIVQFPANKHANITYCKSSFSNLEYKNIVENNFIKNLERLIRIFK